MQPESPRVRAALVLSWRRLTVGVVATLLPAWWATGVFAALMASFAFAATRLFAGGHWLNMTQPTARVFAWRCSAASAISTSSRAARSGR